MVRRLQISHTLLNSQSGLRCRVPSHFLLPAAGDTFSHLSLTEGQATACEEDKEVAIVPLILLMLTSGAVLGQSVCQLHVWVECVFQETKDFGKKRHKKN